MSDECVPRPRPASPLRGVGRSGTQSEAASNGPRPADAVGRSGTQSLWTNSATCAGRPQQRKETTNDR